MLTGDRKEIIHTRLNKLKPDANKRSLAEITTTIINNIQNKRKNTSLEIISRIWETKNLLTNADSRTDTILKRLQELGLGGRVFFGTPPCFRSQCKDRLGQGQGKGGGDTPNSEHLLVFRAPCKGRLGARCTVHAKKLHEKGTGRAIDKRTS